MDDQTEVPAEETGNDSSTYVVLYLDYEGHQQATSPGVSLKTANKRAEEMEHQGVQVLAVMSEEEGRNRVLFFHASPDELFRVKYRGAGQLRAQYTKPVPKADIPEALNRLGKAGFKVWIVPGEDAPPVDPQEMGFEPEPEPREENVIPFEVVPDPDDDTDAFMNALERVRADAEASNRYRTDQMRHQALDWALRLHEMRSRMEPRLAKEVPSASMVVDSAKVFERYLKGTTPRRRKR